MFNKSIYLLLFAKLFMFSQDAQSMEMAEFPGYSDEYTLHKATYEGDIKKVAKLIKEGADPNMQTKAGISALVIAIVTRQPKFVEMLLKYRAAPNIYDKYGNTPLHYAVAVGNQSDSDPLKIPVPIKESVPTEEEMEIIKLLLAYKAPIGYKNLDYQTPLHMAAGWNNLPALTLLIDNLKDTNNLALLNYQDRYLLGGDVPGANTALHYAVMNQNISIVQLLATAGADLNIQNVTGDTPLSVALSVAKWMQITDTQVEISNFLISQKAKFLASNRGTSSLFPAFQWLNRSAIIKLFDLDITFDIRDQNTGDTLLHVLPDVEISNLLLNAGLDINAQNYDGNTPLHLAVLYADHSLVKFFLSHFANPEILNNDNKTPLQLAQEEGVDEIEWLLSSAVKENKK